MTIRTVGPGKDHATILDAWNACANGDTIEVFAGVYSGAGNTGIAPGAKADITIMAHVGDLVVIDGLTVTSNLWDFQATVSNIVLDHIKFVDPASSCVVFRSGVSGAEMVDCYCKLGAQGNFGVYCVGTVELDVRASTFCQYDDGTPNVASTYGIYAPTSSTVTVDELSLFHSLAICIQAGGTSAVSVHRSLLHSYDWNLGTSYGFYNVGTGVCEAVNCIVVGFAQGIANIGADNAMRVLNCLIDNCTSGVYATKYCSAIKNNVFAYNNKAIYGDNGGDQPAPNSNHFFGNSTDVYQYVAATHSTGGDPQFTNRAGHDYTIIPYVVGVEGHRQKTPCIDTGEWLSAVTEDYAGNPRPRNAYYDIGPYESQANGNIYLNRAREIATGIFTHWFSFDAADPAMDFHPLAPNPADYADFVVNSVRRPS
jgi:hypothetical protein